MRINTLEFEKYIRKIEKENNCNSYYFNSLKRVPDSFKNCFIIIFDDSNDNIISIIKR